MTVLVVADLNLDSASQLAEHALRVPELQGGRIDLVLACGPLVQPRRDLSPYLDRWQRRRRRQQQPESMSRTEAQSLSPELTAACEGLVTGALSQLESIVCRVLWVPSKETDPVTTTVTATNAISSSATDGNGTTTTTMGNGEAERRLTPNARNIHGKWMSLAPGIGCCGVAQDRNESLRGNDDGLRGQNIQ